MDELHTHESQPPGFKLGGHIPLYGAALLGQQGLDLGKIIVAVYPMVKA